MKRNFLKLCLIITSTFTCFLCEASSSIKGPAAPDGISESIPTAQQWNKDVVGWNLGNEFECSAPGQSG